MDDRPPRHRLRRLAVLTLLLLFAVAAAVWFAPLVVAKTGLKQSLLDGALADLNGRATVADASLGWLSPVVLRGLTVTDPAGATVLTAESVTSSKTLLQLARDRADLGTFTVAKPVVNLVCKPGATNVEEVIAKLTAGDGTPPPTRPAVRVEVVGGRLVQTEPGTAGESVLDPVDATAVVPAARTEPVTLDAKAAAGGTLTAAVAVGSPVTGKLSADRFPLDAVGPIVRRFRPGTRASGILTADLSGGGGEAASLHGRIGVTGLSLEAPWLGPDRLRLASAELPIDVALVHGELEVRKAELTCDVGRATATGKVPLDGTAEQYAGRAGLTAAAEIDVAKLAAVLPRLLRLKPGTALTEGKLTTRLASVAGPGGTHWQGSVVTTAVRGTRDDKPLAWDQPLAAEFDARIGADRRPVFDKLEGRSEFAAVVAAGSLEKFQLAANLDLDRLAAKLGEFVDLGGTQLRGRAGVQANGETGSGGRFAVAGKAELTGFAAELAGLAVAEPAATVTVRASGVRDKAGPLRLDVCDLNATAGGDRLTAKLLDPVADARTARAGRFSTTASGDLLRWRQRLVPLFTLPADWLIGGAGTVTGTLALTDTGVAVTAADVNLKPARFRGMGLDLDEPTLTGKAAAVTWERAGDVVRLAETWLSCPAVTLNTPALEVYPAVAGTVNVVGSLGRLTAPMKLPAPLDGVVRGPVALDTRKGAAFSADLRVEPFVYGPPTKPIWREPWVKLRAVGESAGDALRFTTLAVERDGATVNASGSLDTLSKTPTVNLTGTLAYDLAKLEPQLRDYLGAGAQVSGRGEKPFRLTGPVGGSLDQLAGEAAVGWQAVKAYGFDVGPGELKATLARGQLDLSPVQANFGGGTVRLDPQLDLTRPNLPLSFTTGTVIDHAKLTPQATAGALGYALPAIANAAQADGTVSFQLDDNRIPLADPNAASLKGKLVMHTATLSAGPVFAQVLQLLDSSTTTVTLAKEQVVPVAVEKGRVYHDNFNLTFGQTVVKSKGSVGLADQSLQLELELPIPPRAIDGPLKNNPRVLEALRKQTIKVPVGGTMKQPRLDPKAFEAGVAQALRGVARDATRGVADDFLKRGLGELQKKLEPKKP